MATRKPARSAKKAANAAKPAKPTRVAKQAAKAEKAAKAGSATKAPEPRRSAKGAAAPGAARPRPADTGGYGHDRAASIERGIMGLGKRLRAPSRTSRPGRRTGPAQDPDRLDAALKRLRDRYRSLLE